MTSEQLLTFAKSKPITVGCGVLALVLAVEIYLRGEGIPEGETRLDQKSTLGERIDANLKNGVQLAEQYAAIAAARQQIEMRLVRPDELAKNLQFFYKLEADTATKLVDLRQNAISNKGPKPAAGTYFPVGYAVAVRGTYAHLLDFLRRLESGQRFCRVLTATIGVAGPTDKDRANDLTLNLSLELLGQP